MIALNASTAATASRTLGYGPAGGNGSRRRRDDLSEIHDLGNTPTDAEPRRDVVPPITAQQHPLDDCGVDHVFVQAATRSGKKGQIAYQFK